jgi:hypothetical protein
MAATGRPPGGFLAALSRAGSAAVPRWAAWPWGCAARACWGDSRSDSNAASRKAYPARNGYHLRFTIFDDGTGYNTSHTPIGSGLRNMADRLAALGGRLQVRSAPGQGITITGYLPVPSCSPAGTGS